MENSLLSISRLPLDLTDSESELPSDYDEEVDPGIELGSSDSISDFELASQHQTITDPSYIPSETDSVDNSVSLIMR